MSVQGLIQTYILGKYVNRFEKKKFGKFGSSSTMGRPLALDHKERIYIGEGTTILKNVRMQFYPVQEKLTAKIKIGDGCFIAYNNSFLAGADIVLGNQVLLASNILISSENHGMNPECDIPYMDQQLETASVSIGDGAWIGERVIILPGVRIGEKAIVGAGSIVTKTVPAYSIAVGNPAKIIKKYNFESHCWEKCE